MTGINNAQLDQNIALFTEYMREVVGVYKTYLDRPGADPEELTLDLCVYLGDEYNVFQLASMVAIATGMLAKGGVSDVEILSGV